MGLGQYCANWFKRQEGDFWLAKMFMFLFQTSKLKNRCNKESEEMENNV